MNNRWAEFLGAHYTNLPERYYQMAHVKTGIYAIIDSVADNVVGGLQLHRHDAPAVRVFMDAANTPGTMINQHKADFQLVRLGYLTLENKIEDDYKVILEGETLEALKEVQDTDDSSSGKNQNPPLSSRR